MTVHDYSTGAMPDPDEPQWDTTQLQQDFGVLFFAAPYVGVKRKSDGVEGTLQFNHQPRVYWGFTPISE